MKPALASTGTGYGRGEKPRIRLMIVDDSMVARAVLTRMLEADGGFEIAAVAGTAEDAIDALAQVRVDIILLDLEMPGAGGLKSIPRILEIANGAQVMIVSSLAEEGAEDTVAALALGAADTLPKPGTGRFNGRFSEILMSKLRALGRAERKELLPPCRATARAPNAAPLRALSMDPLRLIAMGASTGGIHALASFFQELPPMIGVPILVTQHLPAPFMAVFARQLGNAAGREAIVAQDGLRPLPDRIVIAPGDAHLTVDINGGRLVARLVRMRSSSGCLPSVDSMLASGGPLLCSEALRIVVH